MAETIDTLQGAAGATLGKVTAIKDGSVVFVPAGTSYELYLLAPGYDGRVGKPVRGIVRVKARKVWSVPSGGNFIAPIFGPPRIIQGRVRAVEARRLVVQAGALVHVELPEDEAAFDLASGQIAVGRLVNVTAFPGAGFERVAESATAQHVGA